MTAALALACLLTWHAESDLRDLGGLQRADATVLEVDEHRRSADQLTVQFDTGQGTRQVTVPHGGGAEAGDVVAVGFVADDPSRARTVEGWYPAYQQWGVYMVLAGGSALLTGVFGLASRWRGGRWETDTPVGEARQDPLGRRVVHGSVVPASLLGGLCVAFGAALVWMAVVTPDARPQLLAGAAGFMAAGVAVGGLLHWWSGRDGVWTTDEELVARRRGRVRRWPWAQVHELGFVVEKTQATVAAARVDDGLDDGIATDGWVTLARPLAGPLAAHEWATRFRALADERGLPLTEGLSSSDLADSLGSTYVRRRASRIR